MEKIPQSIAKGLVAAQGAMRRVGHDAANAFHKYKYTSAEALIEAAREPMMAGGLALIEAGFTLAFDPIPMVTVSYFLVSNEGESWELPAHTMPVLEEKGRPLDKAVATARTYALGYALRGVLKIPRTEGDDDVDQRDDRNREPQRRTVEAADVIAALDAATTKADLDAARRMARSSLRGASGEQMAAVKAAGEAARLRIEAADRQSDDASEREEAANA